MSAWADYIEANVHTIPEAGCWLWARTTNQRYGLARAGGRRYLAHRFSWITYKGAIPARLEVCHRCDTPLCVNPDHLFLATHRENMHDMRSKGRQKGWSAGKLSEADVAWIRANAGVVSQSLMAKRFGITKSSVSSVQRRKTYVRFQ